MSVKPHKRRNADQHDSNDDSFVVEPLTALVAVPDEWRLRLPSHIKFLAVTPRMAATFHKAQQHSQQEST